MTPAQELGAGLCQEGGRQLALGAPALATAFYLAGFSCHAPSALRCARAALAGPQGAAVVTTLEAWCRGDSQIPTVHWDGMAVVSLTGTLASAFLGALCPGHPAAVLHSLAGLLAGGHHDEVARRCGALLDAHSQQALELQLTRALAWVLSGAQVGDGVAGYLRAFAASADRTVAFIRAHQRPYLPTLLGALRDHSADGGGQRDAGCRDLLAALDPGARSAVLPPDALLRRGRFEECLAACSAALQAHPAGSGPRDERLAALLVTRAAAAFFLGGRAADTLRDLHRAFLESPAGARGQLRAVLSAADRERVCAQAREAADAGFARFLAAVRRRPELRGDAGRELLTPVTRALRVLLRLAPRGARPALGARLAECLLLAGRAAAARALCERLLRPPGPGAPAPLLALRGFCALHAGDAPAARADFQAAVSGRPPHPGGCVRALCGRGLLRVLAGSAALGALDYVTACRLRPDDALLAAKALVPGHQRALLQSALRDQGRRLLLRGGAPACPGRTAESRGAPGFPSGAAKSQDAPGCPGGAAESRGAPGFPSKASESQDAPGFPSGAAESWGALGCPGGAAESRDAPGFLNKASESQDAPGCPSGAAESQGPDAQDGDAQGVYQLARLLTELDAEDEASRLLAADALYRLGRLDEALGCLQAALSRRPRAAPVLARLAVLQLRRGSCDAGPLVEKVVQAGDTACLQSTLDVFHLEDRRLLWGHCHARALSILRAPPDGPDGRGHTREAIAYLSLAIFAAGTEASESLLARARCYGLLGQKKTAMFDFNAVLRAQPGNVQALCGRALVHLALDRLQEAVDDITSALKLDRGAVVPAVCSLRPEARALLTQGLYSRCRALLGQLPGPPAPLGDEDTQGLLAVGEALIEMDATQPRWHVLLADIFMVLGSFEEAGARLRGALLPTPPPEAARARRGLLRLKEGDAPAAARDLRRLAESDAQDLGFLLGLLQASERQRLAQAAAQEASTLLDAGQPGRALGYCSLAVLASGGASCHLRARAACLAELGQLDRAVGDLDCVLQGDAGDSDPQRKAEDLCSRGRLLLGLGDPEGAAGAFVQALQLSPALARSHLRARPGQAAAADALLRLGQRRLAEQRHQEAWSAAQSGLLLDPRHRGLRRLKARTPREASGCRLH